MAADEQDDADVVHELFGRLLKGKDENASLVNVYNRKDADSERHRQRVAMAITIIRESGSFNLTHMCRLSSISQFE